LDYVEVEEEITDSEREDNEDEFYALMEKQLENAEDGDEFEGEEFEYIEEYENRNNVQDSKKKYENPKVTPFKSSNGKAKGNSRNGSPQRHSSKKTNSNLIDFDQDDEDYDDQQKVSQFVALGNFKSPFSKQSSDNNAFVSNPFSPENISSYANASSIQKNLEELDWTRPQSENNIIPGTPLYSKNSNNLSALNTSTDYILNSAKKRKSESNGSSILSTSVSYNTMEHKIHDLELELEKLGIATINK